MSIRLSGAQVTRIKELVDLSDFYDLRHDQVEIFTERFLEIILPKENPCPTSIAQTPNEQPNVNI